MPVPPATAHDAGYSAHSAGSDALSIAAQPAADPAILGQRFFPFAGLVLLAPLTSAARKSH